MKKDTETKGLRTWIDIDKKALASNFKAIRDFVSPDTKVMAVAKSNAYGHSLIDFSQEMQGLGVDWIGVDSIVEAMTLRESGITKPLLVLGYTLTEMLVKASELDVSISVSTFETLDAIAKETFAKKLKIHVKTDTGMHRQGFQKSDIARVIETLKKLDDKIEVEGLFTHFGAAKNPLFPKRTNDQIELFKEWIDVFKKADRVPIIHACASGGAFIFPQAHFDMVRVGIAMYGLWPSKEAEMFLKDKINLKPILTWKTIVSEVKNVPKGDSVGYDFTEEFSRDSKIAVCPVGYWHGYPRALSSIGHVLVCGVRARVIGRVSMDMITIDVTDIEGVKVGDEVTLIGTDGKETVSAEDIAHILDGSLYEIVTRLNPLIKRIYR